MVNVETLPPLLGRSWVRRHLRVWLEAPFRRPLHVAVPTALALLAALGSAILLPPRYRAGTTLRAEWEIEKDPAALKATRDMASRRLQAVRQRVLDRSLIARLLREAIAYPARGETEPSPDQVEATSDAVSIKPGQAGAFTIGYEHRDPVKAALVANRLATLVVEAAESERASRPDPEVLEAGLVKAREALEEQQAAVRRLREGVSGAASAEPAATRARSDRQRELEALTRSHERAQKTILALQKEWTAAETASRLNRGSAVRFEIVEPALVPQRPFFPSRRAFALVGLALGLALGLAAAIAAELRDRTVRCAEDLQELLAQPLLAQVPLVRVRRSSRRV
jgi:uncharacterized protein involved in exopolysaccharide biosynthesis